MGVKELSFYALCMDHADQESAPLIVAIQRVANDQVTVILRLGEYFLESLLLRTRLVNIFPVLRHHVELLLPLSDAQQPDPGSYAQADTLLECSLELMQKLGNKSGIPRSPTYLGRVALSRDEHEQAALLLNESLALFREVGDREGIATALEGLAGLVGAQGQAMCAAQPG